MNDQTNPTFWMKMTYACELGCTKVPVLLEYGCEGPRLRGDTWLTPIGTKVVPVPFCAGMCPNCQKFLIHSDWNEDETLFPMFTGIPESPHFRYPTNKEFKKFKDQACGRPVNFPSPRFSQR